MLTVPGREDPGSLYSRWVHDLERVASDSDTASQHRADIHLASVPLLWL